MPFFLHSDWLFFFVFVNAAASTFYLSASQPMVTYLTKESNRHQVNSILSTVGSAATFIGPLAGGWMVIYSTHLPFVVQSASYLFSAATVFLLPLPIPKLKEEPSATAKGLSVFWSDILTAFHYLRQNLILRKIIYITSLLNLGTGAISAYEALFLTRAVHLGGGGYGLVVGIQGLAMVFAGMANARLAKRFRTITLVPSGAFLLILGLIPYAFSHTLFVSILSSIILATGLITLVTAMRTVRQNTVPVEIQGRVITLQLILPNLSAGLSILVGGALLPFLPIRTIIIGCVAVCFVCLPVAFSMFKLVTPSNSDSSAASVS